MKKDFCKKVMPWKVEWKKCVVKGSKEEVLYGAEIQTG